MKLAVWFTVLGVLLPVTTLTTDLYMLPKLLALSVGVTWMWIARKPGGRKISRLDASVLAMLGAVYLTSACALDSTAAFFGEHGYYFGSCLTATLCALAYFAAKGANENDVARAVTAGAVIVSVYAIFQQKYEFLPIQIPDHRSIGTIGSPPFLGCVLAGCLPLSLNRKSRLWPWLIALGIAFSGSRAAYLGAAAGIAVVMVDDHGVTLKGTFLMILAMACALLVRGRMTGDRLRLETWASAARIFFSHPLLGVGPENFTDAFRLHRADAWLGVAESYRMVQNHAHNDFLQVAATMGLVGLAAYAWMHFEAARAFAKAKRPALGAIVAVLVYGKFDPIPMPALALLALVAGAASGRGTSRRQAWTRWGAFVAAGICLGCVSRIFAADVAFHRASVAFVFGDEVEGVAAMRRTLELYPQEVEYRIMAIESLFNMWRRKPSQHLLLEARMQGAAASIQHPGNVMALEMYGVSAAMYAIHGYPQGSPRDAASYEAYAEALEALQRTVALDHNSQQAYEVMAHLCAHFRDLERFRVAVAEIQRISNAAPLNRPEGMICKLCGKAWKDHH